MGPLRGMYPPHIATATERNHVPGNNLAKGFCRVSFALTELAQLLYLTRDCIPGYYLSVFQTVFS